MFIGQPVPFIPNIRCQSSFDIPLKMPFESSLHLTFHSSGGIEDDNSIRLDECSDMQHRNENTFASCENQWHEIR